MAETFNPPGRRALPPTLGGVQASALRKLRAATRDPKYEAALGRSRQTTLEALTRIDDTTLMQLTQLTLPEIRAIQGEIAQVFPAGNLPAFVLSGLIQLKGRLIQPDQARQDINALLRGISLIPEGLYGVFVAGPAAVLYAYQKLLQLAGKDPASAFPYGTWQFYLQFGLREDTARHTNETIGFHSYLNGRASPAQADLAALATAWMCAALELIYRYDDLLAADWSERVMLRLLMEEAGEAGLADQPPLASPVADWNQRRPYHRPADGSDYFSYRATVFQQFAQERLNALPATARERLQQRYKARLAEELAAYQEQMTILAALKPDRYQEHKEPISLCQAAIAFTWQGHTYLLPVCQRNEQGCPLCFPSQGGALPIPLYMLPGGELCDQAHRPIAVDRGGRVFDQGSGRLMGRLRPPEPEAIKGWLTAILAAPAPGAPPALDLWLASGSRALQSQWRDPLPEATRADLAALRCAPIVINWDAASSALPLAYIRQGRRGIGDHALTIFRTDKSFVFDQSHIFFDGMWGMSVAEILTDSAIHWHRLFSERPAVPPAAAPAPLALSGQPDEPAPGGLGEAAAESAGVDTRLLRRLRKWLGQRGVRLTVSDLLLLYRFFHAAQYQPSPAVTQALADLAARPEASEVCESIHDTLARLHETNPALLVPMDASYVSPKERVFPTTFRNPLTDIQDRLAAAQQHYQSYRARPDSSHWQEFDAARRELLAYLKAFGDFLDALKAVTMRGQNFNTATIKLLAHLPASMQYLLDQIPQRIGFLNEIIKGNEVFSNVGRTAPGASLTRFISAKDDGQTKELVWGVITDDQDRMHISLRDFRPFVPLLLASGQHALADLLARDYLDSYVEGFNSFVGQLAQIVTLQRD